MRRLIAPTHLFSLPTLVLFLLLALSLDASSALAQKTVMRGCKAPNQFKIHTGNLTQQQIDVLKYALKQWVMYDSASVATGGLNSKNRNETASNVMSAGPKHHLGNAGTRNPAKKHALSSRSISPWELKMMRRFYGTSSPFKPAGQDTVADPVANPGAWFTNNANEATIQTSMVNQVPGRSGCQGRMHYKLTKVGNTTFKGRLDNGPAKLYIRNNPGKNKQNATQRTWCYPTDTDGDGFITNMDKKCPENTLDYYQIMKHEIGHFFCFWHKGTDFSELNGFLPFYGIPIPLPGLQSPHNESGCCHDRDSEFAEDQSGRIYFASDLPGGYGGSDIWFAEWNDSLSTYGTPVNAGPLVNSAFEETHPESGAGDAWLYFASNRPGGFGGFDLFKGAVNDTAGIDSVAILPAEVNSSFDEIGPSEWNDRIYFASNRPGGSGGMDLWIAPASATPGVTYDPAVNAGAGVNSSAEDIDPFVAYANADTSVIYFSSDRGGGIGGFDIYRAEEAFGVWSPVYNLGSPVNEPSNELRPYIPPFHDRILFSTDRDALFGTGLELMAAPNMIPRPRVLWAADDAGAPGDTVLVEFSVFNEGNSSFIATPTPTNLDGWGIGFDPSPFGLDPDEVAPYAIEVIIPGAAAIGDTSLVILDIDGDGMPADNWARVVVVDPASSVDRTPRPRTGLGKIFPNPSNPSTTISYNLDRSGQVHLAIYGLDGRLVATVVDELMSAGPHEIRWNGRDDQGRLVSSGAYFARLEAGGVIETGRLVLLK